MGQPNFDSVPRACGDGNRSIQEIRKARHPESAQIHDRGDYDSSSELREQD